MASQKSAVISATSVEEENHHSEKDTGTSQFIEDVNISFVSTSCEENHEIEEIRSTNLQRSSHFVQPSVQKLTDIQTATTQHHEILETQYSYFDELTCGEVVDKNTHTVCLDHIDRIIKFQVK